MSSETGHHHDPLDPEHLFGHVQDAHHFELPHAIADEGKLHIWQPFEPFVDEVLLRADPDYHLAPFDLLVSKFMILEVIAAAVLIFFFIGLARKISDGSPARGKWSNMLESMLVFIRDEVARPAIGREDADRFLPFLWTMFFFVLICNFGDWCTGHDVHAGNDHLWCRPDCRYGKDGYCWFLEVACTAHGSSASAGYLFVANDFYH